jgi:Domain of unknown function (DUF4430)
MLRRCALPAIATALTVATAGCGLGAGRGTSDVTLTVSRGFGSVRVAQLTVGRVPGAETVMRLLERHFRVATRYGGGFVQSIGSLSGTSSRVDWFYYVNGVEAPQGAATTDVHGGDRIWWDLHDWSAAQATPAVVGSFPEPFVHGVGGKRLPTTLECASDVPTACQRVSTELTAIGVPIASGELGTGSGTDSLAVEVGTWKDLRGEIVAGLIQQGPGASGVYAKFAGRNGAALELLDPDGNVVTTLGPSAGLVAATAQASSEPTWLITGTDAAGVSAAAAAFTTSGLRDHFAVAVQGTRHLPVPLEATR